MPWGHPHTFICAEPECRKEFESYAINPQRCPACRTRHKYARMRRIYRQKRGAAFGVRAANKPLSDAARFNIYMARTWETALCPVCHQHMSVCRCCEPQVRHVEPIRAATWKPWE